MKLTSHHHKKTNSYDFSKTNLSNSINPNRTLLNSFNQTVYNNNMVSVNKFKNFIKNKSLEKNTNIIKELIPFEEYKNNTKQQLNYYKYEGHKFETDSFYDKKGITNINNNINNSIKNIDPDMLREINNMTKNKIFGNSTYYNNFNFNEDTKLKVTIKAEDFRNPFQSASVININKKIFSNLDHNYKKRQELIFKKTIKDIEIENKFIEKHKKKVKVTNLVPKNLDAISNVIKNNINEQSKLYLTYFI
jgi:hypothetical protein